jgi:1-deoxy-D-xylulose-5-phosphate reductoisomerase
MPFRDIVPTIDAVLGAHDVPWSEHELTVDDVLAADSWARTEAAARLLDA